MATRLEWGLVPHPLPIGIGTAGQAEISAKKTADSGAVIIPEWWAELSRNELGEFPKEEPRFVR